MDEDSRRTRSDDGPTAGPTAGPIELAATRIGDGPRRVAFLHGLMGRGKNFTRIARGLGEDFTSLLIDLPDHGASPWTERIGYVAYADAVADFLAADFAAAGPIDLLGHSMGGKVAMVLALRHPRLVERLVVVDIAPVDGGSGGQFEHLLGSLRRLDLTRLESRRDADAALAPAIPDDTVRGFLLQNLRSAAPHTTGPAFEWQPNLELLADSLPAIGRFPPQAELTHAPFDGPVLWVAGGRSDYIDEACAPRMRELFPRTTRITIRDAGHWVHSERPAEFLEALRAFLLRGRP